MIKIAFLVLTFSMFISCSFKAEPNDWQYKSSYYFSLYKNNFFYENDILAKNDFKRAVQSAKKSANFNTLARVYLGKCALNISVGFDDKCIEYKNISDLIDNKKLDSYYHFITKSIKLKDISILPKEYIEYANYSNKREFDSAKNYIFDTSKVSATFLMASLMRDSLTKKYVNRLVKLASFYGYKRVVLFWLEESKNYTDDKEELRLIDKKIYTISN